MVNQVSLKINLFNIPLAYALALVWWKLFGIGYKETIILIALLIIIVTDRLLNLIIAKFIGIKGAIEPSQEQRG